MRTQVSSWISLAILLAVGCVSARQVWTSEVPVGRETEKAALVVKQITETLKTEHGFSDALDYTESGERWLTRRFKSNARNETVIVDVRVWISGGELKAAVSGPTKADTDPEVKSVFELIRRKFLAAGFGDVQFIRKSNPLA